MRGWTKNVGVDDGGVGTPTLRHTEVAQIYRKKGNLRAVQLLLGHAKIERLSVTSVRTSMAPFGWLNSPS